MRLLLLLALAAACAAFAGQQRRPSDAGKAPLGKKLFEARCAACHGSNAKGSAAFAKQVGAYSPESLDLTSERLMLLSDAALGERIMHGHGKMKGFDGKLSSEQVSRLVAYLRLIGRARADAGDRRAR